MEWNEMYNVLIDVLGVSEVTLGVACSVGGCNKETMEQVLYYFTGWKSFEGFLNELNEEEDE
jgi:hypothetical protein